MSSLCLTAGVLSAHLFAQTLHLAWTPADGTPREVTWRVAPAHLEFAAERMADSGGAKPPAGAQLIEGWYHAWPARGPQPKLMLERATLKKDYVFCGQGWCRPLEAWLPRAQAPVVELRPCGASG